LCTAPRDVIEFGSDVCSLPLKLTSQSRTHSRRTVLTSTVSLCCFFLVPISAVFSQTVAWGLDPRDPLLTAVGLDSGQVSLVRFCAEHPVVQELHPGSAYSFFFFCLL